MAPEAWQNPCLASDIYSLGKLVLTTFDPYYDAIIYAEGLAVGPPLESLLRLTALCFNLDPGQRPTLGRLREGLLTFYQGIAGLP